MATEQKYKAALEACIPWLASVRRGAGQEALAQACELVGYDPFAWSAHPEVLLKRRPDLERRGHSRPEGGA